MRRSTSRRPGRFGVTFGHFGAWTYRFGTRTHSGFPSRYPTRLYSGLMSAPTGTVVSHLAQVTDQRAFTSRTPDQSHQSHSDGETLIYNGLWDWSRVVPHQSH